MTAKATTTKAITTLPKTTLEITATATLPYMTPIIETLTPALLVYNLRTQNLKFVAPMPEQTGTPTMHFSNVSGGPY